MAGFCEGCPLRGICFDDVADVFVIEGNYSDSPLKLVQVINSQGLSSEIFEYQDSQERLISDINACEAPTEFRKFFVIKDQFCTAVGRTALKTKVPIIANVFSAMYSVRDYGKDTED